MRRAIEPKGHVVRLAVLPRAFVDAPQTLELVDALREPHAVTHFAQLKRMALGAILRRRAHERDVPEISVVIVDRDAERRPSVRARALWAYLRLDADILRARTIRQRERRSAVGLQRL